jgi:hypothetical protein
MSGPSYKRLLVVMFAIVIAELLVGVVGQWVVLGPSTCRAAYLNSVAGAAAIGIVMFVITSLGSMWQGFLGRRIERRLMRSSEQPRSRDAAAVARVDRLTNRLEGWLGFTHSMWTHPWLTGAVGGLSGVVLFLGLFTLFGLTSPNSCA